MPHLLASQQRALAQAIASSPLHREGFSWEERSGDWAGYVDASLETLVHSSSGAVFCAVFQEAWNTGYGDHGPEGFWVLHTPGVQSSRDRLQLRTWDDVYGRFQLWLRILAREIGVEGVIAPTSSSSNFKPFSEVWPLMHPDVVSAARARFDGGHLADAVEASLKHINERLKPVAISHLHRELDGADLMKQVFSARNPLLILGDPATESGKNEQQGYMEIFAGAMTGIRNPKAHANINIDHRRAVHLLFLCSLLCYKIDEARQAQ